MPGWASPVRSPRIAKRKSPARSAKSSALIIMRRFPLHDFQVEDGDAVEDRDQKKRDEGSNCQSADLGVAERLPERSAVAGEEEESENRCADGNEDGAQTLDSSVANGLLERLARFVHFLDEIEEHDNVADDNADEAGDS